MSETVGVRGTLEQIDDDVNFMYVKIVSVAVPRIATCGQDSYVDVCVGPVLLEDYQLVEKIAQFDRERIPERVVHARGASAKGFFEVQTCLLCWEFCFLTIWVNDVHSDLPFFLYLQDLALTSVCTRDLLSHHNLAMSHMQGTTFLTDQDGPSCRSLMIFHTCHALTCFGLLEFRPQSLSDSPLSSMRGDHPKLCGTQEVLRSNSTPGIIFAVEQLILSKMQILSRGFE